MRLSVSMLSGLYLSVATLCLMWPQDRILSESQISRLRGGDCYVDELQDCETPADLGWNGCTAASVCAAPESSGKPCNQPGTNGWYQWQGDFDDVRQVQASGTDSYETWEPAACLVRKQCRCLRTGTLWICVTEADGEFDEVLLEWHPTSGYETRTASGEECQAPT